MMGISTSLNASEKEEKKKNGRTQLTNTNLLIEQSKQPKTMQSLFCSFLYGKIYDYDFSLGPIKTLTKAVLDDGMVRSNAPMRFVAPMPAHFAAAIKSAIWV